MRYWLVMPAAGAGRRFGARRPKQYSNLGGRAVIEWSLSPFVADPRCMGIRVAIANDDPLWSALQLDDPSGRLRTVVGGEERCDSVRIALADLPAAPEDWVLVHDAARPCLDDSDLERLLAAAETAPQGALLAQPLTDTLKRADSDGMVSETLDRAGLWRAQTPQMFRYGTLTDAYAHCMTRGLKPSDEAQAVEALGLRPQLVEGLATNIKLTTAADLALALGILKSKETE